MPDFGGVFAMERDEGEGWLTGFGGGEDGGEDVLEVVDCGAGGEVDDCFVWGRIEALQEFAESGEFV